MTLSALRTYLYDHIPLARAMAVEVLEAGADHVLIEAPLAPNLNMHGTMFGGSAATLALLAAWSVLHLRLEAETLPSQLVVHRTEMEYLLPIEGCVRALARLDEERWPPFRRAFDRRGRGRIAVAAELLFDDQVAGRFSGEFVAISQA